ncbi:hypothetical protein [Enterococcus casseliflavus]|uniref:hypothetical protein n=1 Tax=Enterococcus casseliflavus TaxID=37734 RepID=UPI001E656628|nr:hypothetical protein [Enterococcus casseliflavus]MCD4963214.1 hypothetical protein [Enterococcus casseliflavus]
MKNNDDNLTPMDYVNLAIEAGIGAIPIVGSPIQTIYFGRQNEKRFKRIERFYTELNEELEKVKGSIPEVYSPERDRDQLIGIFESINEDMEKAKNQSKIKYYKNLFKSCIIGINKLNWDREEYFVEALSQLTTIQIDLLGYLFTKGENFTGSISYGGVPQELTDGSLNMLSDLGLLDKTIGSIVLGDIGKQNMGYKVSSLGREFISYTFA